MSSAHGEVTGREPCTECGSTDNVARYADGYAKCFTPDCGWYEMPEGGGSGRAVSDDGADHGPPLLPFEYEAIPKWNIRAETCRTWDYGVGYDEEGQKYHVANEHAPSGRRVAQKVRRTGKRFQRRGKRAEDTLLFGARAREGTKRIHITEGEKDCLAVAQALDLTWPVVSVPDGAPSALRSLQAHAEWLDTFEEIVILFDDDEPGQKAAVEVAEQLAVTPGKIKLARMSSGYKDPAEAMIANKPRAISEAIWAAKPYTPGGVVAMDDLLDLVLEAPAKGTAYPWVEVDDFLHGMRAQELVVWCAGSGVGKSAFVKQVAWHLAMKSGERVGLIFLEEGARRTQLDLMSMEMGKRLIVPEVYETVTKDELTEAHAKLAPHFLLYDHFGSMDDDVLMAKIRWMAAQGGCKWIIFDHLSIVVSGDKSERNERRRIDNVMTDLRSFVQKSGVGMHLVSHLRRNNKHPHEEGGRVKLADLRGSGAIGQLCDIAIGVERNQQADHAFDRDVSTLRCIKNRTFGDLGPMGQLYYDKGRGLLVPAREAAARHHFPEVHGSS